MGQGVPARLFPPGGGIAGAEPDLPLAGWRRDRDAVSSARVSALIRAVARQPAMTSCALRSMASSAASDSAEISSSAKQGCSVGDRCRAH